ncbi:MAG TPA: fluoride efflux transporter CrcB [Acidimicrobiales bacterium]|nr:fluoride efflux transporter CrcB [Acidimicrobiales bacterium]
MTGLVEVGIGGLIGAPTRFVVDQIVTAGRRGLFPWGTFVVNAAGAFILGLLDGLASYHGLGPVPTAVLGTGFCGALTTFSTLSYETLRLLEEGTTSAAVWNVAGSLAVGLAAAGAGIGLAAIV